MSRVANKLITSASGSAGDAYEIDQSLIFDQASNSQLSRVVSSAGNRKTYTFSTWIKKTSQDDWQTIIAVDSHITAGGNDNSGLYFYEDTIYIVDYDYSTTNWLLRTNRLFRDNSAWYHIVYVVDTTQGTAANRVKLYINGVQETSFSTETYPGADVQGLFNSTLTDRLGGTLTTRVGNGSQIATTNGIDGILAETHFIDGTALTPSSFGETKASTGQWVPKEVTGLTYGTNGFYFPYQQGGQSVFFGTNQRVYIDSNNAAINVGTGDYTYEFWFYNTGNANNYPYIIDSGASGNAGSVYIDVPNSGRLLYHASQSSTAGPSNVVFATSTTTNTWYHVAISRSSGTTSCYLNGTRGAEVTDNGNYSSQNTFLVGGYIPNNDYNFTGLVSNLRIIKGSGIYSGSSITVPTARLTNVTNTSVLILQGLGNSAAEVTVGPSLTNYGGATVDVRRPSSFTTLLGVGTDHSGQGNDYTPANLANSDVVTDTPTNNFCTWNPLDNGSTVLSQGNLKFVNSSGNSDTGNTFAIPHTGKWYFEHRLTVVDAYYAGFLSKGYTGTAGSYSGFTAYQIKFDGQWYNGSDFESYASSFSNGDILGWAIDCDNGKVYVSVNGTFANSGNPVNGTNPADTFTATADWKFITYGNSGSQFDANFGQNGTFNGLVTAQGNADGGGIGNFYYAPPSGFKALCFQNLPDPTIAISSEHFNTVLYTGNETARSITGVGFEPSWVWIKERSAGGSHRIFDQVRGVNKVIQSDLDTAELDRTEVTAFNSDGFSLADSVTVNQDGVTHVAWNWKAGGASPSKTYAVKVVSDSGNKYRFDDYGSSAVTLNLQEGGTYTFDQSDSSNATHPLRFSTTSDGSHGGGSEYTTGVTTNGTPGSSGAYTRITVAASAPTLYYYCTAHSGMGGQVNTNSTFGATNLDGSILSVVSENTTSGFSIVIYTGTGSNATVGHELGVAPSVILVKNRESATNWLVYSRNDATDYLVLNDARASTDENTIWNDTAPTSSVFSIGTTSGTNTSGDDIVAYCFAEVEGFSKFGTYEANNSTNGPFISTGFTPAWILFKYIDGAGEWWWMLDSTRDPTNLNTQVLYPNSASAEGAIGSSGGVDFLSNGFKIRATNGGINSANTYFYMAFAESPFKYANAR